MPVLENVYFGNDDALQDQHLGKYFLETTAFRRVLDPLYFLYLGSRGTGKTATRIQAQKQYSNVNNRIVVSIDPSKLAWGKFVENSESLNKAEKAAVWEFILYCEIFRLASIEAVLRPSSRLTWWRRTLNSLYGTTRFSTKFGENDELSQLIDFATRVLSGVEFKIAGVSIKLNSMFDSKLKRYDARGAANYARKLLKELIKDDARVLVLIDHLDEYWTGSQADRDTIASLLEAVTEIRQNFHHERINFCVFLRSDIFNVLSSNDKAFWFSSTFRIEWDREKLFDLVLRRLQVCLNADKPSEKLWHRVFKVGPANEANFGYFLKRSLGRPRDVIHFINKSLTYARDDNAKFVLPQHVKQAEYEYSDFLLHYFNSDLAGAYPYMPHLTSTFRGRQSRLTKTTFDTQRMKACRELCKTHGIRAPSKQDGLEIALENSFLGVAEKSGATRFTCSQRDTPQLVSGSKLIVHPGLNRSLRITR